MRRALTRSIGGHRGPMVVSGLVVALVLVSLSISFGQGVVEEQDTALLGEPEGRPLAGEELHQTTEAVTSLMRCPVCQGLSVADSHTPLAIAMKAKAEALLAAGYSRSQVLTYFESAYGEFIRLSPRPEGFNLVVWILPGVALLIGIGLVWRRLRRRPAVAREVTEPDEELEDYRRRVREELGR